MAKRQKQKRQDRFIDNKNVRIVGRVLVHLVIDFAVFITAFSIAYGLAFHLSQTEQPIQEENIPIFGSSVIATAAIFIAVSLLFVYMLGEYKVRWRFTSTIDVMRLLAAHTLALLFLLLLTVTFLSGVRISFVILYIIVSFVLILAVRFFNRLFNSVMHYAMKRNIMRSNRRPAIIYGAGSVGHMIIEQLINSEGKFIPVGIIDDDLSKKGSLLCNIQVYGGRDQLANVKDSTKADTIIIAIQKLPKKDLKELFLLCKDQGFDVKIVPPIVDGGKEMSTLALDVRDIHTEELLGRDEFEVNMDLINHSIRGKVVLVTGGAGSIGSELCRQALNYQCKKLIVYDVTENSVFFLNQEFSQKYDTSRYTLVIGSVRDKSKLKATFDKYRPDIVFHAAAYKHVPMMEFSATEAIKNNVLGTRNVIDQCNDSGVKKFVLISTDKAVNPANVMGASKRIAEMVVQTKAKNSKTQLSAVRFGNVLGSAGSVVGIFLDQIRNGGPITLTDRYIKRYFMTIPEACRLVMQTGALAKSGEVFVLDMGDPVYIYDLACDLIKMNGLVPDKDIEIKVTGLRPGEKMFEELRYDGESVDNTIHKGIFTCKLQEINTTAFNKQLALLETAACSENTEATEVNIFSIVPNKFRNAILDAAQAEKLEPPKDSEQKA